MSERAYPIPRPPASGDDPRFTFGLAYDLSQVLKHHGYPPVHGADLVELQQALFRFIYAADDQPALAVNVDQAVISESSAADAWRPLSDTDELPKPRATRPADVDPVSGRDYEEEAWQRAEAEREGLEEAAGEADPWWLVIYSDSSKQPSISVALPAATAELAERRWKATRAGESHEVDVLNLAGPFTAMDDAYAYRRAWQGL